MICYCNISLIIYIYFTEKCKKDKSEDNANRIFTTTTRRPATTPTTASPKTQPTTTNICIDKSNRCSSWVNGGYCRLRPDYMTYYCRKSCDLCHTRRTTTTKPLPTTTKLSTMKATQVECKDGREYCKVWASVGFCVTKPYTMGPLCPESCNICNGGNRQSENGLTTTTAQPTTTVNSKCKDQSGLCSLWKAAGYCSTRQLYMKVTCPRACKLCSTESSEGEKNEQKPEKKCEDVNKFCSTWARRNKCHLYKGYMKSNCAKSCDFCDSQLDTSNACIDENKHCKRWARNGYCNVRKDYMATKCRKSCKFCR